MASWNPFSIALCAMLVAAAVYEPMRSALWPLGDGVGGVGGVGGLTNQFAPTPLCNRTAAFMGMYCYKRGVVGGLTPFAVAVLLLWVLPMLLAALYMSIWGLRDGKDGSCIASSSPTVGNGPSRTAFVVVWCGLNVLWAAVPFSAYFTSDFYRESGARVVLGVALAASFPLSWHVMFVALPVNSFVAPLIGWSRGDVYFCHRFVGAATAFWALVHGLGEFVYLLATKTLLSSLDLRHDGENLIFVSGVILLCIMLVHVAIVLVRMKIMRYFYAAHRTLALIFLLVASFHWWPFAFFLVPVAAMQGVAGALAGATGASPLASWCNKSKEPLRSICWCLTISLAAGLFITTVIWELRQVYMLRPDANRYVPFVFPPLVVALTGTTSWVLTRGCLWWSHRPENSEDESLLIGDSRTNSP